MGQILSSVAYQIFINYAQTVFTVQHANAKSCSVESNRRLWLHAQEPKGCAHATFCFNKNRSSNHGLFRLYRQQNTVPITKLQHLNPKATLLKLGKGQKNGSERCCKLLLPGQLSLPEFCPLLFSKSSDKKLLNVHGKVENSMVKLKMTWHSENTM